MRPRLDPPIRQVCSTRWCASARARRWQTKTQATSREPPGTHTQATRKTHTAQAQQYQQSPDNVHEPTSKQQKQHTPSAQTQQRQLCHAAFQLSHHGSRSRASGCCVLRHIGQHCRKMEYLGSWCGGITPAQHAGGPGLKPQRVHCAVAR